MGIQVGCRQGCHLGMRADQARTAAPHPRRQRGERGGDPNENAMERNCDQKNSKLQTGLERGARGGAPTRAARLVAALAASSAEARG